MSANALRRLELDCLRGSPVAQCSPYNPSIDENEADATADDQLLSHLVGEVTEVSLVEAGLRSVYDLHATGRKSKSSNSKKDKKHSKKAKVSKSPNCYR